MKFRINLKYLALAFAVALLVIGPTISVSHTGVVSSNIVYAAGTTPQANPTAAASSCGIRDFGACIRQLLVWPFAGLDSLGVFAVTLVGNLFDVLIDHSIVRFGDLYNSSTVGIGQAVATTWTVFRDIANILIIGMFTFIAISIILGIQRYGQKKFIADVLLIAVLINFSLLFTKVIIDGSNFTSTQFYNNMALLKNGNGDNVSTGGTTGVGTIDIAGAFMKPLGLGGISDNATALDKIAAGEKGITAMMTTAILAFVFLMGVAAVFGYGCFILISRAILLVFLLLTSSLAFASYLIPSLKSQGWTMWWSKLLNSAVLAPLFMLLLWATLKVANAMSSNGTIGMLIASPDSISNVNSFGVLFNYLIILGLLFVSFSVASRFSSSISEIGAMNGFLSKTMARIGGGAVAGASASYAVGMQKKYGGRAMRDEQTFKAEAARRKIELTNIDPIKDTAAYNKKLKEFNDLQKSAADAGERSKREFNLMNTALGKKLAQKTGIGTLGQTTGGGQAGRSKAIVDDAAKSAAALEVTNKEALNAATAMTAEQRKSLVEQKAAADKLAESTKKTADEAMKNEGLEPRRQAAAENVMQVRADVKTNTEAATAHHQQEMKDLAKLIAQHDPGSEEADILTTEKATREAAHKSALDKETARITEAQKKLDEVDGRIAEVQQPYTEAKAKVDSLGKDIVDLDKATEVKAHEIVENSKVNVGVVAKIHAIHHGADSLTAERAKTTAEGNIKKKSVRDRLKERLAAEKELNKDMGIDTEPSKPTGGAPHA